MLAGDDKPTNLRVAEEAVRRAAGMGAQIVSLPEIWNGPYAVDQFAKYAEEVPPTASEIDKARSPSVHLMHSLAKELGAKGIRVNTVTPGMIATGFHDKFSKPEVRKNVAAATSLW